MIELLLLLALAGAAGLAAGAWRRHRRRRVPLDVPLRALDFVAIDTETTGLDRRRDALVAIAAMPFRGGQPCPDGGYTRLVNPGRPVPPAARAIHGLGDDDLRLAEPPAAVLPGFLEACRGRVVVAHTADFDLAFINRAARQAGLPPLEAAVLDIGILAHALFPSWWDLSLEGLGRLLEVQMVDRHTARGDALTAGLIFLRLIPRLEQQGITTLRGALRLQRRHPLVPGGPGATGGGLAGP